MKYKATERIKKLRQNTLKAQAAKFANDENMLNWYRGYQEGNSAGSHILRRGMAYANALNKATPIITEYELIVGKPNFGKISEEDKAELIDLREKSRHAPELGGQQSHMAIDYEKLITKGINGVIEEINDYKEKLNIANPEDIEKDEFYKSCLLVLNAVKNYAKHYSECALELSKTEKDETRKKELQDIAEVFENIPQNPAKSFREAIQAIHFINICHLGEGLYQLGRPDRYLLKYYEEDIKNGVIIDAQVQELIDCVCILHNDYVNYGLALGFMVGGTDKDGKIVVNPLTYMFIESIGHTSMVYPGVGLCYDKNMPDDLLMRSIELLGEGYSHPAIFNDEVIINGLIYYGMPREEACEYIHSTCVEITPIASSGIWVASPYHNLTQYLLDILQSGKEFESFDDLIKEYNAVLAKGIEKEVIRQNKTQFRRYHAGGNPLVSCFVNDCLKRGKDIDQGGARYSHIMPSFVGIANVADSLMTLKRLVFEQKRYDLKTIYEIINSNFEGQEVLRQEILNTIPKYGNDNDEVDSLVEQILQQILAELTQYRTIFNDRFIPSLFCWVMHERLGSETIATPDGRLGEFPFGDGAGPAQGRESNGPTSSILSSTKWEHDRFIGGVAVNIRLNKNMFAENTIDKTMGLIKTFINRGGFEIQINVVDNEILKKAQKNPELYQDLVVRIGGYSDYFVRLSEGMQKEVMLRTMHN